MTPSRSLYNLIILGAVPFLLSAWWTAELTTVGLVYDFVLVACLALDYALTQHPDFLAAQRTVADRLSIGRANKVFLEIYNKGPHKLTVRLRDNFPHDMHADTTEFEFTVGGLAKANLIYYLTPKQRGSYKFGSIDIRYLSFLRLFWRTQIMGSTTEVKVFSDLKALHDLSVKLSHSSELGDHHRRYRGQGTDFASLKEYTSGDDTRSIDWKATARRDSPVVRTYEAEQEQVLLILIDAGRMMLSQLEELSRFDHALNAAVCLSLAGLYRNDQVGLGVFAHRPLLYLPARRGKGHLKRILEAVFDVNATMVEPDYVGVLSYFASVQKGRCLMVVITDLTDPLGSQTLLAGLAKLSPRHLPFCVTLKDRQIDQIACNHSTSINNIYRRAVAVDLLNQRELALRELTSHGCLVLDCPPQELSSQLVDRYLEIKAKGKL